MTTAIEPGLTTPGYLRIALVVGLTYMVLAADLATVSVALPSLARDLGAKASTAAWVISAYSLASAGFLIAAGRLGGVFGARRCLLLGAGLYASGAVLAGCASQLGWVIGARTLQGLGSALLSPISFALITTHLNTSDRPRAMGLFAVLQGVGSLAGPLLGGWVTTTIGWRAVFFICLPIIGIIAYLVARMPTDATTRREGRGFDYGGLALVNLSATSLLLAITRWETPQRLMFEIVAVSALAGLVWWEARARNPLIPPSLLAGVKFRLGMAVSILLIAAAAAFTVLSSIAIQTGLGFSPTLSGLGLIPYAAATIAAGRLAPWLLSRWRLRRTTALGLALLTGGSLWPIMSLSFGSYWLTVAPSLVLAAAGIILTYLPMMAEAVEDVDVGAQSTATGVLLTLQQLAAAAGAAGVLILLGKSALAGGGLATFTTAYGVVACLPLVALALVLFSIIRSGVVRVPA
jgi:MFS family permease